MQSMWKNSKARNFIKVLAPFVQVLNEVSQLITGGNMQMQMIGCSILSALMAEYATTVKSSDVGLAWEIHFKAKKQFELTDLKSIFQFCVQALKGELNIFYDHYRTRPIISRGLYIFNPPSKDYFFVFKKVFSENSVLMYGLYSRAAYDGARTVIGEHTYVPYFTIHRFVSFLGCMDQT